MRSFRLVCAAAEAPLVEALLTAQGYAFDVEPFDPAWARRLTAEPRPLGDSLAATFGLIYIQDRSSMLPPLALDPPAGSSVLDMCASPGGKSGLLARLVGPEGFVLANEPGRDRLATLRQNLRRMNVLQAATCGEAGEDLPLEPGSWPHIQLDPPCSGWGTAEKNPKVLSLWREDKVAPLLRLQRALLVQAARLLAPGGRLLYSTCTTNEAENEAQVEWALAELPRLTGAELRLEPLAAPAGFVFETPRRGLHGVLRVDSQASEAQGFFLAALRKAGEAEPFEVFDSGDIPRQGRELDPALLASCGLDPARLPPGRLAAFGDKVLFLPRAALALPDALRWQGFHLGKLVQAEKKGGARILPWPRLRALLPDDDSGLVVDDPADILTLLAGRHLELAGEQSQAPLVPLRFRSAAGILGLGLLSRKGRRLLWSA